MEANIPQEKAIKTIDKNIAVNAGAGTGKTKVLTERFIEILKNGDLEKDKEVEGIVAITFTKKASQEMVDRIREEIRKNFPKGEKWSRYYRDMEKSNISTIHSFCANILRENPIEARIDPMFEVLEDYTSTNLLKTSINEILFKAMEENEDVYKILRIIKNNTLNSLIDDLNSVYNMIRTVGISFKEVKEKSLDYINALKVEEEDIEIIKDTLSYLIDNVRKGTNIAKLKEDSIWINFCEKNYRDDELPEILAYLASRLGTSKAQPEKMDLLKTSLEKASLASERENTWIYSSILDLIIDIDMLYTLKKREIGGLDYDDLQIITSNLLDNEEIRNKYQNRYRYIMVDEFQDTNELQKNIIYKLVTKDSKLDGSNLFIVGDPKQSIYGFRGADIDVFYEVVEDIKEVSMEDTITLEKNYRTVGTVLDFVNNIFGKIMGTKYDSLSEFWQSDNQIDVEVFENPGLEIPEGQGESEYHRHYEADLIAKRIKQLVQEGKFKYGDFAMLFRATTRNYIYEEALKNFGIPYYNTGGKRYFLQQEVLDIINALKSLSNPFDQIATIGFLRSPMIGLKDTSIFWIIKEQGSTVYERMLKVIHNTNLEVEEIEKIKSGINLFEELYEIRDFYGLLKLVDRLIKRTYFIETLLLKEEGKQSIANVYKFKDIVNDFERKQRGTLEDFIDYLEESRDRDESQGKVESENADVVKLLTIHKSKGLQFPVVIIPEMSTGNVNIKSNMLFDKNIGIGLKLDSGRALFDFIKKDIDEKDKEERERVLYVAMTRAEKMLILGNQGKDLGFKKLVKDIIDPEQCRVISNIDMTLEGYTRVNLIDEDLINEKGSREIELPLLYEVEGYGVRTIERFSISQYLTFVECKRRFFMDYYRKVSGNLKIETEEEIEIDIDVDFEEEYSISAIEKGNIIHKFCEQYNSGLDENILIQDICKSFGVGYNDQMKKELRPYIDNYLKDYKEDWDKVYIEKEFYLKIGDSYITGIIDRINIKDNKAEIIDFKTNKMGNKNRLIKQYTPQLQLYAYVIKGVMGMEIERARLSFLENGDHGDILIEKEDLEKNLNNIKEFIEFVRSNGDISDYKQSEKCNDYCKHKLICSLE